MDIDTLTINHREQVLAYRLAQGGYSLHEGLITISVETEPVDEEQFPDCALFCLDGHSVELPVRVGDVFEASSHWMEDPDQNLSEPFSCAYFTSHSTEVFIRWTVKEVNTGTILFDLEARHDDVMYYDDRAVPTTTSGLFRLQEMEYDQLWVPM